MDACDAWSESVSPLTAGARCQPAALRRGGDETLTTLRQNHIAPTFSFVLKNGQKKKDTLARDSCGKR